MLVGILNKIGKRHRELAPFWIPSALAYTTTGALLVFYLTDWRVVVDKIPFYNTKFSD